MDRRIVLAARQPDLEALRALASLMVFTSHLPWYQYFPDGLWKSAPSWLSPSAPVFGIGGFAVVWFLVLSGVGLCRLLVIKAPPAMRYLRDRLGKLYTIFWAIGIPAVAIAFLCTWLPFAQIPNAVLMLLGLGWVTPGSWAAIFPSWWYMGIAVQAVLVAPLMLWMIRRITPWGALAVTAAVVVASCFVVPALGFDFSEKALIICRALEVLGGMFLALEMWPDVREKLGVSRRGAAALVTATFAILVIMLATGLGGRWLYRAAGLAVVAAVVYLHPMQRFGSARLAKWAAYAGGLSFAFYLIHEPTMLVIRRLTGAPNHIGLGLLAAISFVVVSVLAVIFTEGVARAGKRRAGATATGGVS